MSDVTTRLDASHSASTAHGDPHVKPKYPGVRVTFLVTLQNARVSMQIDVGFGNHLYLRGEGPGLTWDHGIAMDCTGAGLWTASVKNAKVPVTFKLLVNDVSWSTGNDYVVAPGQSITVTPSF